MISSVATVENGCLQYVPGSHRWSLLPITGLAGETNAIEDVLAPEQRAAVTPVPIALRRGEATFHHPLMVHGSTENRSGRPRRSAVINVVRDGVRSLSNEPLLEGLPVVPSGHPLGGQVFPLLTDSSRSRACRLSRRSRKIAQALTPARSERPPLNEEAP